MQQEFESYHLTDEDGKPAGGYTVATGISIHWQNGPLGRGEDRKEPNGAFVETLIAIARERLAWYQSTEFKCSDNAFAMQALDGALECLERRTRGREQRGVEGTYEA